MNREGWDENLYEILGVGFTDFKEEIDEHFKQLKKQWARQNTKDPAILAQRERMFRAYDVLRNGSLRMLYDEQLIRPPKPIDPNDPAVKGCLERPVRGRKKGKKWHQNFRPTTGDIVLIENREAALARLLAEKSRRVLLHTRHTELAGDVRDLLARLYTDCGRDATIDRRLANEPDLAEQEENRRDWRDLSISKFEQHLQHHLLVARNTTDVIAGLQGRINVLKKLLAADRLSSSCAIDTTDDEEEYDDVEDESDEYEPEGEGDGDGVQSNACAHRAECKTKKKSWWSRLRG